MINYIGNYIDGNIYNFAKNNLTLHLWISGNNYTFAHSTHTKNCKIERRLRYINIARKDFIFSPTHTKLLIINK